MTMAVSGHITLQVKKSPACVGCRSDLSPGGASEITSGTVPVGLTGRTANPCTFPSSGQDAVLSTKDGKPRGELRDIRQFAPAPDGAWAPSGMFPTLHPDRSFTVAHGAQTTGTGRIPPPTQGIALVCTGQGIRPVRTTFGAARKTPLASKHSGWVKFYLRTALKRLWSRCPRLVGLSRSRANHVDLLSKQGSHLACRHRPVVTRPAAARLQA